MPEGAGDTRAILDRDKWRCTAMVEDRLRPGRTRRCTVMGSEMVVRGGRTLCPRCAREADYA